MATKNEGKKEKNGEKPKRKYKSKELYRKDFEMDDAHLAQNSRTWQSLFVDHLAAFEAFDPNLDVNFANDWMAKIEAFENHPSDKTMLDDLQDKTQTLAENTAVVMGFVDDFEYFVKRAFPDDKRMLLEFGLDTIRNSTVVFRLYENVAMVMRLAQDYNTELTAAGMPANLSTQCQTALSHFGDAELEQEYAKRLRIRATTKRIKMFNELYAIKQTVHTAAKIVFRSNPTIAGQFA